MSAKAVTDGSPVMTRDFRVSNKLGIHARPAAMFVKAANRFSCEIFVEKDGEKVNGKSIMGVMMLAAEYGATITLRATGLDADDALDALATLVASRFGET